MRPILVLAALLLPVLAAGSPASPRLPRRLRRAGEGSAPAARARRSRSRRSPGGPRPPGTAATPRRRSAGTARGCAFARRGTRAGGTSGRSRTSGALGAQAARAFARFVALKPDSGPGWALRGLSEFQAKNYDAARCATSRAASRSGPSATPRSATPCTTTWRSSASGPRSSSWPWSRSRPWRAPRPRRPTSSPPAGSSCCACRSCPADVPEERRELVQAAGRAAFAALGLKAGASERFEEAARALPRRAQPALRLRRLPPAAGRGARGRGARRSSRRRSRSIPPRSTRRLEIAFELLKRGEHAEALPYAESAVRIAPGLFAGAPRPRARPGRDRGRSPAGSASWRRRCASRPESPEMRGGARPGLRAWRAAARTPSASARSTSGCRSTARRSASRGSRREDTIGQEAKKP